MVDLEAWEAYSLLFLRFCDDGISQSRLFIPPNKLNGLWSRDEYKTAWVGLLGWLKDRKKIG